jgi:hypothetical protein
MVLSGRLHARKRAKLKGCASALEGGLCGRYGHLLHCGDRRCL